MMRFLVLAALVAAASASCPNDCSGHGMCNQYSACECYRNWMGADCSERMCAYGKAFVDTPQGDINADGVVERPDTLTFVLGNAGSFFNSHSAASPVTGLQAGTLGTATTQGGTTNSAVILASGESTNDGYYVGMYITVGANLEATGPPFVTATGVQTRKIVDYDGSTLTATVSPPFTTETSGNLGYDPTVPQVGGDGDAASKSYMIHSYPDPARRATAMGGCEWDGSEWDCGGASFFTLGDWPADGHETRFRILGAVNATSEMTSNGNTATGLTSYATTIDSDVLTRCNDKFGSTLSNAITHAIRVHAIAEHATSTTNKELGLPVWQTANGRGSGSGSGLTGLVETFFGQMPNDGSSLNVGVTTVNADGSDESTFSLASTHATATGADAGVPHATDSVGSRIEVCFTTAGHAAAVAGKCYKRTIATQGGTNGVDITVTPALPAVPKATDTVRVERAVASVTSAVVCSPGVNRGDGTNGYSLSSPHHYDIRDPDGTTYPTQWSTQGSWEAYPTEHGFAKAGIQRNADATADRTYTMNVGGAASAGTPSAVTAKNLWDEAHFYRECSGKGSCDRASGKCECFAGYAGTGCIRLACPNDCSGHGQCRRILDTDASYVSWDFDKTAKCVCENGYGGLDCSNRLCPKGDDPITRGGDTEIQTFGVDASGLADLVSSYNGGESDHTTVSATLSKKALGHAMFALEFTDEMGDKWVTHLIDFTTGNHAHWYDTAAGMMRQPKSVNTQTISGTSHGTAAFNVHAQDDNAGNFDDMYITTVGASFGKHLVGHIGDDTAGALSSITDSSGTAGFDGGGTPPDNVPYEIHRQDYRLEHSLAQRVEVALENLPNNVLENVEVSVSETSGLIVAVTFAENTGDVKPLGVRYCWNFGGTDNEHESEVQCNQADGSFADTDSKARSPQGTATSQNAKFVLAETRPGSDTGSKENVECSNRGLCDYSSGLCKCFKGYTDFDCSLQNSLAQN